MRRTGRRRRLKVPVNGLIKLAAHSSMRKVVIIKVSVVLFLPYSVKCANTGAMITTSLGTPSNLLSTDNIDDIANDSTMGGIHKDLIHKKNAATHKSVYNRLSWRLMNINTCSYMPHFTTCPSHPRRSSHPPSNPHQQHQTCVPSARASSQCR